MNYHFRIQWPDGSFLPILLQPDATSNDLKKMLKFAFGPNEVLKLFINNYQICIDEDVPMNNYGLKDGDTINAIVLSQFSNYNNRNNRLRKAIDSILLEAAKVSDVHLNQIESNSFPHYSEPDKTEYYPFIVHEPATIIPSKADQINSSPMPQIFSDKFENSYSQNTQNPKPPLFSSIQEAGDYFCDQKTDFNW